MPKPHGRFLNGLIRSRLSREPIVTMILVASGLLVLYSSLSAPVTGQAVTCTPGIAYIPCNTSTGYQTAFQPTYGQTFCPPGTVPTYAGYCVVTQAYTVTLNTTATQFYNSTSTLVQIQTQHMNVTLSSTSTEIIGAGPVVCWSCSYGGPPFWFWPALGGILAGVGIGFGLGKLRPGNSSPPGPSGPSLQPIKLAPIDCGALQTLLNNIWEWIQLLSKSISNLTTQVIQLESQLNTTNQQISALEKWLASIGPYIAGLQAQQSQFNSTGQALKDAGDPSGAGSMMLAMADAIGKVISALQNKEVQEQQALLQLQSLALQLQNSINVLNNEIAGADKTLETLNNQFAQTSQVYNNYCVSQGSAPYQPLPGGGGSGGGGGGGGIYPQPQKPRDVAE